MVEKKYSFKQGMFILPSLFTLANMFCGFYSVILAFNEKWLESAMLLTLAGIMDGLDGMVARVTKTTSDFGINFDSIVDVVSFGICPALIIYFRWLQPVMYEQKKFGWMLAFLFLMAGAIRLARFNVAAIDSDQGKKDFRGLPITAAALMLSTSLWVYTKYLDKVGFLKVIPNVIPGTMIVLTYLMISNIKYPSLKKIKWKEFNPYVLLFTLAMFIFLLMMFPGFIMFTFTLCYVLSGPVKKILQIKKVAERRKSNEEKD